MNHLDCFRRFIRTAEKTLLLAKMYLLIPAVVFKTKAE